MTFLLFGILRLAGATAEENAHLEAQVLTACKEHGVASGAFPQDIQTNELVAEAFEIDAMGDTYTMWLVTTTRQPSGVEFGWVAYHTPSHTVQSSARTAAPYEQKRDMLLMEVEKGCYYCWSAEEKAQYSYGLYGENARITFPDKDEMTQLEAVETACKSLKSMLNLTDAQVSELMIEPIFYQDETRYWGITFRKNALEGPRPFETLYAVVIDGPTGAVEYAIDYRKDLIVEANAI